MHAASEKNLENTTQSERHQTPQTSYCVIPLTGNIQMEREMTAKGYGVYFGDDENVHIFDK